MIRVLNTAEHCVFSDPPNVVNVPAQVATILLPSEQHVRSGEIAYRQIQNVGGDNLYYSFGLSTTSKPPGAVCDDAVNFNGYLVPGAMLDCSNDRQVVCGYSKGGTQIATTIKRRKDLTN